ncbi:hypothetical protein EN827_30835 [Mesorhizobium sp. M1D.F.Ca.ET.184.01.1.1]|nr:MULTISPECIES: hypothetical protein [unclassified Mesorhizobium]TGP24699.1 hypothetical protein EN877_30530 [Mesorhizobium sp. M1D.F.Ca.ET.234.01.1.1]TGS37302.1 hypothetical protein EN827_30835 [Mesorhizobium sp. M1D.F.Ca.ET.184.01.1.1]
MSVVTKVNNSQVATCAIDGCAKPARGRGWCLAHYGRWRRNGDPLAGRTPNGDPRRYLDEVVLAYEGDECLIWPFARLGFGYANLAGKVVSRLVCERVNGPPPTPDHEAAHSCGKGHLACVTKGHISWKTTADNLADRREHGTFPEGDKASWSKLTSNAVREIRELKGQAPLSSIAEMYGVSKSAISQIHSGKNWRSVT